MLLDEDRSRVVELLTGVDSEIAQQIVAERIAAGQIEAALHAELSGVVARYAPERSLATAIAQRMPSLLAELHAVPGAADGIQQVMVSLWQHGFRQQRAIESVGIRDARMARPDSRRRRSYELRFTVFDAGVPAQREPAPTGETHEVIEKRSAQIADVFEKAPGAEAAAIATLSAIKRFALRMAWPQNQTGIRDGYFLPTPGGGELRFEFYRSLPRNARKS